MKRQISVNLGNLLLSLSESIDIANPLISQHQQRTAFIAIEIAKNADPTPEVLENIFCAALLHDIGAITVEEKIAIHEMSPIDLSIHCIRGELLLEQIPLLRKTSKIVRNHHRKWIDWDESIDNQTVFCSQVILLADYIERMIDRNKYILHQNNDIIENVKKSEDVEVNHIIVDYFIEASKREEFWLDIASPRLYPILLHNGPYRNVVIDLNGIILIADLFRNIIDFKSSFTATHTTGVSACAGMLSQLFGLSELEVSLMEIAGNLHDIGKLVIPNSIIEKPGKLTPEEFAIMRCHTYYTFYIINSIGGLQQIAEWAAYHHEKLDGTGYPFHCKANELDTGSRIMCVADIYTAISENRPYRKSMNKDEVYKVIRNKADMKSLDTRMVDLLFDNYEIVNAHVSEKQFLAEEFYAKRFLTVIDQNNILGGKQ